MASKPLLGLGSGAQAGIAIVLLLVAGAVLAWYSGLFKGSGLPAPGLSGTWVFDQASWTKFRETVPPFGVAPVEDLAKANLSITLSDDKLGDFITKTDRGEHRTTFEVTYTGSGVVSVKLAKNDPSLGSGQVSFQRPKPTDSNPQGLIMRWGTGMAMPLMKR